MQEILDDVDPEELRPVFADVCRRLQRGKGLEPMVFLDDYYLLTLDGSGYFSSSKIHCPSCQVNQHANGTVTYEHQMLTAVLVHPDHREVIPLAPEPIRKPDGGTELDDKPGRVRVMGRRWNEKGAGGPQSQDTFVLQPPTDRLSSRRISPQGHSEIAISESKSLESRRISDCFSSMRNLTSSIRHASVDLPTRRLMWQGDPRTFQVAPSVVSFKARAHDSSEPTIAPLRTYGSRV